MSADIVKNHMTLDKYIIILVLQISLCLSSLSAKENSLDEYSSEPLRIVFVEDNAPFSLMLPDGTPTGLYVEFWQLWSEVNNVPVVFIADTMTNNIKALKNNDADFHIGLFVNDKRLEWGDFSIPIHRVDTGVFFRGNDKKLSKLHEMSGQKVAVLKGTFQLHYLKEKYPELKLLPFEQPELALTELLNGKVDAIVSEIPHMNAQIAKMGLRGVFRLNDEKLLTNEVRAFAPKSKRAIISLVNAGIQRIPVNRLIELEKKWLPDSVPFFNDQVLLNILTSKEKEWLKSHSTLKLGIDHSWFPFEYVDSHGKYVGLSSDYVDIVKHKLAINLKPAFEHNWNTAFEALKQGELDVISAIVRTDERAKIINFTEPYISLSSVITTRKDAFYVLGMNDLLGKRVGVIKGYVFEDYISKDHPDIQLVGVENVKDGLEKLKNNELDAFIDALASINHEINKQNHNGIIVAAFTPYKLELSMGVRKGLEPLVNILNKALSTIDTKKQSMIANNWLSVAVNLGTSLKTFALWAIPIVIGFLLIILYVLRANRRMVFEIVERKKIEKSLEKAKQKAEKANQAKDNFLANMSHEIRTPMNAVVGMSHLLSESGLTERQRDYNNTLKVSAASLLVLIDDILDLSKVEAGKLVLEIRPFKLTDVMKNINDQIALTVDPQKIKINLDVATNIPETLYGDPVRLGQVLLNIANNAAKFTKQGIIDISVMLLNNTKEQIILQFCVSDTGIGMTLEQQRKLFKTYSQADSSTTRKFGGTGLGLTISKELCELMDGTIWLESKSGVGSRFYFTATFEYSADKSTVDVLETNVDPREQLSILLNKKILLVDDNQINLTVAKAILMNAGLKVDTAVNGRLAIQAATKAKYDAILMDIQMPVMDGFEATEHIRNELGFKAIPIIAVSANVMKKDIEKSLKAGMNAHIAKPLRVDLLLKTLAEHMS